MGGGVHWAEWIMPMVGGTHTALNMGMQAIDLGKYKPVTPGSKLDKERKLGEVQEQERIKAEEATQERQRLAETARVEALPENVRKRASQSAESLGSFGRRPRASQYLSGA